MFAVTGVTRSGWLATGDGHEVYWEEAGNPEGLPVLMLHGGPGSGFSARTRQFFDPQQFRLIGMDQRGCGRSRPHAGDGLAALEANTTAHLVEDIERLRLLLGVAQWRLFGHSWGVTLGLAYAEAHPQRVAGAVFVGVTTTRRREIDWLYHGIAPLFPVEWQRFASGRAAGTDGMALIASYADLLASPDPAVHMAAARAFDAWDNASVSVTQQAPHEMDMRRVLGRARIVTWYFRHLAFLREGVLLEEAGRLAGIPGWLVQGRLDLQAPLLTAWELAQRWPDAKLMIVENAGHAAGDPGMGEAICEAVEEMGARLA